MNIRYVSLLSSTALALLGQPAWSQTAQGSSQPPAEIDGASSDIIVTGIRGSIASSIAAKREANQVVDSVRSEDIGKLPDTTVADALQRIPGVQITRNFGQGSRVVIRGLQSNLIEIDGRPAYGNPLESANGGGDNVGRNFGLESVPSFLISRIDVFKTPTASQIEGGLGGVIDAVTIKPLDFKRTTIIINGEGAYGTKSKQYGYTANGIFATQIADDKIGILVGISRIDSPIYLSGVTRGSFVEAGTTTAGGLTSIVDQNGDGKRDIRPNNIRAENFANVHRRSLGLTGNVTFRPINELTIMADTTTSDLRINRDVTGGYVSIGASDSITNPTFSGNSVVKGTVSEPFVSLTNFRGERVRTRTSALSAEYKLDGLEVRAQYVNTLARFDQINNGIESRTVNPLQATFDYSGGSFPSLTFADPAAINTVANFGNIGSNQGFLQQVRLVTKESAGRLDFKFPINSSFLRSVEVGGRYSVLTTQRDQFRRNLGAINSNASGSLTNVGAASTPVSALASSFPSVTNFYYPGFPSTFILGNVDIVRNGNDQIFGSAPLLYDPTQYYRERERSWAGYIQMNFETTIGGKALRGNFGTRLIHTDFNAQTYTFISSGGILQRNQDGSLPQATYDNSYFEYLPSANIAYNLTEKLILRASAGKVISRQALDTNGLAPNLAVTISTPSIAASGNPQLQPTRMTGFDTTLEWYFAKTGFFGANLFYKLVDGFPAKITQSVILPAVSTTAIDFTTPVNADKGKIKGLEVSFQNTFDFLPGALRHLGALASFTYTDAKTNLTYASGKTIYPLADQPFTGVSKYAYNVTGFYEGGGFNARVSYVWRSKRLFALQSQGNGADGAFDASNTGVRYQYIAPAGSLDASISYDITKQFNVYVNAANLLPKESAPIYYTTSEAYQWRHDIGYSVYSLGFRAKF